MIREDTLMEWGFNHFPDIVTTPTMEPQVKTCEQLQLAKVFSIIRDGKGSEFASSLERVKKWHRENSGLRATEQDRTYHECNLWLGRIRKKMNSDYPRSYTIADTVFGRRERASVTPPKGMLGAWIWGGDYSASQIYEWFDLTVPEDVNPDDVFNVSPWELFTSGPVSIKTAAKPVLKCPLCGEGRYTP